MTPLTSRRLLIGVIFLVNFGLVMQFIFKLNCQKELEITSVFSSVELEDCYCVNNNRIKSQPSKVSSERISYNETTCSHNAFARGFNQSVLAFSLYGEQTPKLEKERGYFEGIKANLDLLPVHYPGHTIRVYFSRISKATHKKLCELACKSKMIDLCDMAKLPGSPKKDATALFPMTWRFFPTLDPQVSFVHVRDLDSRFSTREAAAVSEFLESDKPLHCMRDHKNHWIEMLGGMWGARLNNKTRKLWKDSWKGILSDPNSFASWDKRGADQALLTKHVWKTFGGPKGCLQHDSYLCNEFPGSVPWPTQRLMTPCNFVGCVFKQNVTLTEKCPLQCRPKNHLDWESC